MEVNGQIGQPWVPRIMRPFRVFRFVEFKSVAFFKQSNVLLCTPSKGQQEPTELVF